MLLTHKAANIWRNTKNHAPKLCTTKGRIASRMMHVTFTFIPMFGDFLTHLLKGMITILFSYAPSCLSECTIRPKKFGVHKPRLVNIQIDPFKSHLYSNRCGMTTRCTLKLYTSNAHRACCLTKFQSMLMLLLSHLL